MGVSTKQAKIFTPRIKGTHNSFVCPAAAAQLQPEGGWFHAAGQAPLRRNIFGTGTDGGFGGSEGCRYPTGARQSSVSAVEGTIFGPDAPCAGPAVCGDLLRTGQQLLQVSSGKEEDLLTPLGSLRAQSSLVRWGKSASSPPKSTQWGGRFFGSARLCCHTFVSQTERRRRAKTT